MALEPVIGQDAAEIGVAGEIDPEQVPSLPLPPAGAAVELGCRWQGRVLIGLDLEADALIETHAQQIVDDLEAQRAVGKIDATNVAEHGKPAFGIVAQKAEHLW